MITFFAAPKPFTDPHIATIQRNAIQSWTLLHPEAEVILFGDDAGIAEAAAEFGARHVPDVETSEKGTPLVSDMFAQAEVLGTQPYLCFVNGDIILLPDLLEAIEIVASEKTRFFISGQRFNVDITERLGFEGGWQARLRADAEERGEWFGPIGMDYFAFPPGILGELPPFIIGRAGWDNYMVAHVLKRRIPFVDATEAVFAIHQNHDYSHVKGGKKAAYKENDEAQHNQSMRRKLTHKYPFMLKDATHQLNGKLSRNAIHMSLDDRLWKVSALHPYFKGPVSFLRKLLRYIKRLS